MCVVTVARVACDFLGAGGRLLLFTYSVENGGLVNRVELYRKTLGWSDTIYTWWQRCSSHQAQHVHLSAAPLQTQPWAHLEQPTGQQEQQLFLQEVHLQFLQAQELVQVQEPPGEEKEDSMREAALQQWPTPRVPAQFTKSSSELQGA